MGISRNTIAAFIILIGVAFSASSQPKPNVYDSGSQWLITAYDDTSATHAEWATQTLCFLPYATVGTSIQGVWYSTSFPNWRGRYAQEGDRVLMHGNYANGVGHDGMVIDLFAGTTPKDEGAGQWTEWRETGTYGTTIGYANTRLRRIGRCDIPGTTPGTKVSIPELEKIAADLSSKVKPRLRTDGKPAESPLEPNQVKLPEMK